MNNDYAQSRINYAIEALENALLVSSNVDYHDDAKCEESPAYVIGYSTAIIKNTLLDLKAAVKHLN